MIEEGCIDLLITAAVMGGETRGQRLIAGLLDKKAEWGGGRGEEQRGGENRKVEDVSADGTRKWRIVRGVRRKDCQSEEMVFSSCL